MPLVSVIMPAYNAEKYIQQAIASVLNQSLTDFELIIIDDGSIDKTAFIVKSFSDARIVFISNERNLGLIYSRNLGVCSAKSSFVAFLDSDDIAFPQRLKTQYDYLMARPDLCAVGSWTQPMDENGIYREYIWKYIGDSDFLKCTLFFRSYITTSAFFIRTSVIRGLMFSAEYELGEDYDLYNRCVQDHIIENIQEALIAYRVHAKNTTKIKKIYLEDSLNKISKNLLSKLGVEATSKDLKLHRYLEWLDSDPDPDILEKSKLWLEKILDANKNSGIYPSVAFYHAVAERWFAVCYANAQLGLPVLWLFLQGPIAIKGVVTLKQYVMLVVKASKHGFGDK